MEISSSYQLYIFFLCFLSGIACGVFFDFQRSIRKIIGAGAFRTAVEDVIFDFLCISAAVFLGFYFNDGQMRYYQVMGAISGALFYAAFLSRVVMLVLLKIYRFMVKFIVVPLVKLVRIMLLPFAKIFNLVKRFAAKLSKKLSVLFKRLRVRRKHLKKRMKML